MVSPCSVSDEPNRHRCSVYHATLVNDYRAARAAAELEREAATLGYDTEEAEYGPIITFKAWLTGSRHGEEYVCALAG